MRQTSLKFKTMPRDHQRKEFYHTRNLPFRARIWACRSGKSKITIDELAFQYNLENITGVIIIAPNIAHENWILKELPDHCPVPWEGMIWNSTKGTKRQKQFMADFERVCRGRDKMMVFAINAEALPTKACRLFIKTFMKYHAGHVALVVDEFHMFGSPGSQRTGIVRTGIRDHCRFRRMLSATPIDNSPMAAYSEYELLEAGALGHTDHESFKMHFGVWKALKTKKGRHYTKFMGPQNEEELTEAIAKYTSVVSREDAGLKAPIDVQKHFLLTDRQLQMYRGLKKNPVMGGKVLEGGALMLKLQQITSGFLIDHERKLHEIVKPKDNPRFNLALSETMYYAPGKVVIWCRFTYDIKALKSLFDEEEVPTVLLYGEVPRSEKYENIQKFEHDPGIKALIGQWSAGVGTEMKAADTLIACSHTFDAIHRHQAGDRANAVGKQAIDLIDCVAHNTNDDYILECLSDKENVADRIANTGLKALLERLGDG